MKADARSEGGYTLVEMLVAITIAGAIAMVLGAAFMISSKTTVEANTRLRESHDAQLLTAYFRDDVASSQFFMTSSTPSTTVPIGGCSIADIPGAIPLAMFQWADWSTGAAVLKDSFYVRSSDSLIRRSCSGGVKQADVTVIRNNLSSTTAPSVSCTPLASCSGVAAPPQVQLSVVERSGYAYAVQGVPRTDAASGSTLLGNVSVYVAGNLSMNSQTKVVINNGGIAYITNVGKCTNKAAVQADFVYTVDTGGCGSDGDTPVFPDPLASLAVPTKPATAVTNTSTSSCVAGKGTWNPGYYANKLTINGGCLKSGVYYLDAGASLSNVTSDTGGVLIYVNGGDVDFGGTVKLSPMTTGTVPGVSIFMRRELAESINVQPSNGSTVTIDGIIYALAGSLDLQNQNATVALTGAVVVKNFSLGGNADLSIS